MIRPDDHTGNFNSPNYVKDSELDMELAVIISIIKPTSRYRLTNGCFSMENIKICRGHKTGKWLFGGRQEGWTHVFDTFGDLVNHLSSLYHKGASDLPSPEKPSP